jgi:hypothetical protein
MENAKVADEDAEALLSSYHFRERRFRRHCPIRVVARHFSTCMFTWPYQNEVLKEESFELGTI